MLDLGAELIRWTYGIWPSYGPAIVLASLVVGAFFTPLTILETRLELRRVAYAKYLERIHPKTGDPHLDDLLMYARTAPDGFHWIIYFLRRALLLIVAIMMLMVVIRITHVNSFIDGSPPYIDQKTGLWLNLKQSQGRMPFGPIDLSKNALFGSSPHQAVITSVFYLVIPILFVLIYRRKRFRVYGSGARKACLIGAGTIALLAPGAVVLYLLTVLVFNISVVELMIRRQRGGGDIVSFRRRFALGGKGMAEIASAKRENAQAARESYGQANLWRKLVIDPSWALLLVLIGNTSWSTALLLHSRWVFCVGAVTSLAGFGLRACVDITRSLNILLVAVAAIRSDWRRSAVLLALYFLVFAAKPEWWDKYGLIMGLAFTSLGLTALDLLVVSFSRGQGRTKNVRQAWDRLKQSRLWGLTLMIVGRVEFIVGVVVIAVALYNVVLWTLKIPHWKFGDWQNLSPELHYFGQEFLRWWSQTLAAVVLIGVGQRFCWYARQHLSMVLQTPPRDEPFVLYLRPFHDDPKRAALETEGLRRGASAPFIWWADLIFSGRSEEEQFVAALKKGKLGQVIAVGTPGESRPPGGAMRIYLPQDNWQESVRQMMSQARLVVIALGTTAGTMWELVEAMLVVPPERLLLIVPMLELEYENFRKKVRTELLARADQLWQDTGKRWSPPELPDYPKKYRKMRSEFQLLIYFRFDWEPLVWALGKARAPLMYDTLSLPLQAGLYAVFCNLAAYEQQGYVDHEKRSVVLAIAGRWLVRLAFIVGFGSVGCMAILTVFDPNVSLLILTALLSLAASGQWLVYYGFILRFRAECHLAYIKSPRDTR